MLRLAILAEAGSGSVGSREDQGSECYKGKAVIPHSPRGDLVFLHLDQAHTKLSKPHVVCCHSIHDLAQHVEFFAAGYSYPKWKRGKIAVLHDMPPSHVSAQQKLPLNSPRSTLLLCIRETQLTKTVEENVQSRCMSHHVPVQAPPATCGPHSCVPCSEDAHRRSLRERGG